jgi:hydrogenase nickel incorporation protein HypA/HybF
MSLSKWTFVTHNQMYNTIGAKLMHELSITENILEIAINHANKAKALKISNIYLVIGQLSSVLDDSVQFYWDMISEGTIAQGANLHFKRIPVIMLCNQCDNQFTPPEGELRCPKCNSSQIAILQGEEFYLEAIDIDKGE